MKKQIIILATNLAALMLMTSAAHAQGPECCSRRAIIKSCTIDDPAGMMGSGEGPATVTDLSGQPINTLGPQESFCSSMQTRLAQLLTRDCFHLQNRQMIARGSAFQNQDAWTATQKIANPDEAEYSFDIEMSSGLNEYNSEGRPVRSKINLKLYFDGEQRELVHQWVGLGTWDTVSNSGTSSLGLFNKLTASIKNDTDIEEIIERFEKRPVDCRVEPEKENPAPGEVIDVEITGLRDLFGEPSREFNRIVVHAYSGQIVNGEPCEIGPDYKVFRLDDATVKVKYRATDDCNEREDRITVYSACEILPEERSPISETTIKERIIERKVEIECNDATITIRKSYEKELRTEDNSQSDDGQCVSFLRENRSIIESCDASITVSLKLEYSVDMPLLNQRWEYYKPVSAVLSDFSYSLNEHFQSNSWITGSGCVDCNHKTDVIITRSPEGWEIADKAAMLQFMWIVAFDIESGKAVKFVPAGYNIMYNIVEQSDQRSENRGTDCSGGGSDSGTRSYKDNFEVGPVGEKIPDPTIKPSDTWLEDYLQRQGVELPPGVKIPAPSNMEAQKEIQPDILVKSGDGVRSFGGWGDRRIEEKLDNGFSVETFNYSWSMKRRPIH